MEVEHCKMCLEDEKIFCPRNPDAECLECGARLCGGHIGQHLLETHCIAINNDHCREPDNPITK